MTGCPLPGGRRGTRSATPPPTAPRWPARTAARPPPPCISRSAARRTQRGPRSSPTSCAPLACRLRCWRRPAAMKPIAWCSDRTPRESRRRRPDARSECRPSSSRRRTHPSADARAGSARPHFHRQDARMKLTRLELSGFKSFADTVTLTFEQGVTAIVGPNGCGKSNVSDAVRWVLGEQSARLLRGGKMEDVIFQGSVARRPVNVTEVSLYLDNSDGDLPIAYREVVVTRRLSRSGQSDYLLNGSPVRLRDIQDLLRGTGLGSDAGVVIEAKMIDLLLSDRAEERRSLFEEAAGIGLYRDRKHSTERRLEETATDLQRVEDLIAEVQSQIRSLARQRGKAERSVKLTEEKFAVQITFARRLREKLATEAAGMEARYAELTELLPAARQRLAEHEHRREDAARGRAAAESQRTEIAHRLGAVRVEIGKLDGDLALAAERLANATGRRLRAQEERSQMELRVQQALLERDAAAVEHERIRAELAGRAEAEEDVRRRLGEQRAQVRQWEQELQARAQTLRSLEGERAALEGELASLRERAAGASAHSAGLQGELADA